MLENLLPTFSKTLKAGWNQLQSSPKPRSSHILEYVNGKLYAWGGSADNKSVSWLIYDIEKDLWAEYSPIAPILASRYGHDSTRIGDKIVIFGGMVTNSVTSQLIIYDTASDEIITDTVPNLLARFLHATTSLDSDIYILFGSNNLYNLNLFKRFSLEDKIIENLPLTPLARSYNSAVASKLHNKIFMYGGRTTQGWTNELWEFDILSNSWFQRTPCPLTLYYSSLVYSQGKLFIFGGYDTVNAKRNDVFLEYNILKDEWRELEKGPMATQNHDMATGDDGFLYFFGGSTTDKELWCYKPE